MSSNPMHGDKEFEDDNPNFCNRCGTLFAIHNGDGSCAVSRDGELSAKQLERQDQVDNAIHSIIETALGHEMEWDIELISEIREQIYEGMVASLGVSEMDFYPYLTAEIEAAIPDAP